jgi:hypothetical protein
LEDNIKMDLNEIGFENVDWVYWLMIGPLSCCEHGDKPSGAIACGKLLDYLSDQQLIKKTASWRHTMIGLPKASHN